MKNRKNIIIIITIVIIAILALVGCSNSRSVEEAPASESTSSKSKTSETSVSEVTELAANETESETGSASEEIISEVEEKVLSEEEQEYINKINGYELSLTMLTSSQNARFSSLKNLYTIKIWRGSDAEAVYKEFEGKVTEISNTFIEENTAAEEAEVEAEVSEENTTEEETAEENLKEEVVETTNNTLSASSASTTKAEKKSEAKSDAKSEAATENQSNSVIEGNAVKDVESHTHNYGDWSVDNITGTRTRKCSSCGEWQTEYGTWVVDQEAWDEEIYEDVPIYENTIKCVFEDFNGNVLGTTADYPMSEIDAYNAAVDEWLDTHEIADWNDLEAGGCFAWWDTDGEPIVVDYVHELQETIHHDEVGHWEF